MPRRCGRPSRGCRRARSSRWDPISASTDPPAREVAVVVLDALAAPPDPELRARLGPELHDELRGRLRARALAWARDAAGGREPLQAATGEEAQRLLARHDGPVVLVAPDVPRLSRHHLDTAREDLAAGVLLTSAPTSDGTPFLVAVASAEPELLGAVGQPFEVVAAAAVQRGGELGMLRAERRLATLADARALRADPLAPPELRELLTALG